MQQAYARRVASTPSAVLSQVRGGGSTSSLSGGYPIPGRGSTQSRGTP